MSRFLNDKLEAVRGLLASFFAPARSDMSPVAFRIEIGHPRMGEDDDLLFMPWSLRLYTETGSAPPERFEPWMLQAVRAAKSKLEGVEAEMSEAFIFQTILTDAEKREVIERARKQHAAKDVLLPGGVMKRDS